MYSMGGEMMLLEKKTSISRVLEAPQTPKYATDPHGLLNVTVGKQKRIEKS